MTNTLRKLGMLLALITAAGAAHANSMPSALATQYLVQPGGRIAYDDTGGTGAAVLAVPGIGEMRGQYRYLRQAMAGAGLRFIAMDPRGQGESSVQWPKYTARASARDIVALIDELRLRQVVLVGNSFSAGAVLLASHLAPERVSGVVLIGPVVQEEPVSPVMSAAIRMAFASPWSVSLWMRYWDSLFPARQPSDQKAYRAALRANLEQPGRMDVLREQIGLPKSEAQEVIGRVRVPGLVIMGGKDADFKSPERTARELASRLGAQLVLIDGAGHYPHVEFAETVGPKVVAFAEGVLGGRDTARRPTGSGLGR